MPTILGGLDRIGARFTGTETTEERVSLLASAQADFKKYMMWALTHLDSRNFSEGGLAAITDPIYAKINDQDGYMAQLALEAQGLALRLSNAEGSVTSLQITANSLAAQIADANGSINSLQITAQGLQTRVTNAEVGISTLTQTVNGFQASITAVEGNFLTIQATVKGLTITDTDGTTYLNGDMLKTGTVVADELIGGKIYINEENGDLAGYIDTRDASSYEGSKLMMVSGAITLVSDKGDIFLESAGGGTALLLSDEVQVSGDLIPNSPDRYTCGSAAFPWVDVYSTDGTISASDRRKKFDIDYDMAWSEDLFDRLRPCSFRRTVGDSRRRHTGLIAQDVAAARDELGIPESELAVYCQWDDGCGLRYEELIALLIYKVQGLDRRVKRLEEAQNG